MSTQLTPCRRKALEIFIKHGMLTANTFAHFYFSKPRQQYLFTAVSNQGNGACAGKKAWLCAGSFLGKLAKAGLVSRDYHNGLRLYKITLKGKNALIETNEHTTTRIRIPGKTQKWTPMGG